MRTFLIGAAVAALICPAADAKIEVITTTADLSALAEAIGGAHVNVLSLAKATEDPHYVDPKPSYIVKLNRADVLIEGGAQLEAGWLPSLLEGARNPRIAPGKPGLVLAAAGIELLEVPARLDRSMGDIHAQGNPHFLIDPLNSKIVAAHLAESFCQIDAKGCAEYRARLADFERRLGAKLPEWEAKLRPYQGTRLVAFHNTWLYFAHRFDLKIDLFLEPKPGIPPTPAHLAQVIGTMNQQQIRVILLEPYQNRRTAQAVAEATGAKILELTQYPGGVKGTERGYIEFIEYLVTEIAKALAGRENAGATQ